MNNTKRLYKTEENGMLAGVCAGAAEYFNIDPSIVRLIWAGAALLDGVGIILYIAAWIILPDKKNIMHYDDNINPNTKQDMNFNNGMNVNNTEYNHMDEDEDEDISVELKPYNLVKKDIDNSQIIIKENSIDDIKDDKDYE